MPAPPLPSLERARAEIAWEEPLREIVLGEPERRFAAAAIVVATDGVRREEWEDDVELGEALYDSFPKGAVPAPRVGVEGTWKVLSGGAAPRPGKCSQCAFTSGRVACPGCGGSGLSLVTEIGACTTCKGARAVACTTCGGTLMSVTARVQYVTDRLVRLRHAIVPALGPLRAHVEGAIDPGAEWDERLLFDPQPRFAESAYRGPSATREPDFHGFFFGDALARAIEVTRDVPAGVRADALHVRCFAAPILWLVYPAVHVGIVTRPDGALWPVTAPREE